MNTNEICRIAKTMQGLKMYFRGNGKFLGKVRLGEPFFIAENPKK